MPVRAYKSGQPKVTEISMLGAQSESLFASPDLLLELANVYFEAQVSQLILTNTIMLQMLSILTKRAISCKVG